MKRLKRIYILLLSAVLIIGGSGCSVKNESSETKRPEPTLNEWQKDFLSEQKLPTEYEELNLTQRLSVAAIYEMIMYLEDKYGVTFEYTGYVRPQILENEYMTAIPKGGNELTDTVTVTRQDDGTLKDDYPNIVVRPYFEQMITDYVEDYFGSDDIRVFSTVTKTSINDLTIITEETISGNISGRSTVFISKDLGSKEEMIKFANDYCIWLKKHDISCDSQVMLLYNPDISKINRINYSDYFGKEYIKIRLMCYVEKNGEIKIEERQVR